MSRYACNQCGKGFLNAQAQGSHSRWCKGPGHVARMCGICGMDLASYSARGRNNHDRWCKGTQPTDSSDEDGISSDSSDEDRDSCAMEAPPLDEDTDSSDEDGTVLEYHQALADAGTLDPLFLVRLTRPDKHLTIEERAVLRFLRATETGAGCSRRQVEALLHHARSLGGEGVLLPKGYQKLWNCVERAHGRMMPPLTTKRISVPVPESVRSLLTQKITHLHFNHLDPTEALVRMLVTGPLAADKNNLKIFPRARSAYLDDYCDGERLRRFDTYILHLHIYLGVCRYICVHAKFLYIYIYTYMYKYIYIFVYI